MHLYTQTYSTHNTHQRNARHGRTQHLLHVRDCYFAIFHSDYEAKDLWAHYVTAVERHPLILH